MAESNGFCAEHGKANGKAVYQRRGSAKDRGYGGEWYQVRKLILLRDPICKGCARAFSEEVDHILRLERGGTNEQDNLQGLCKRCHSRKTSLEQTETDPEKVMQMIRDVAGVRG